MNKHIDDPTLDEYLKRESEFSVRYREVRNDGVPPDLDRVILAQAAQQAYVSAPRKGWTRWGAPLALAATLVLTMTVVLQTGVERESPLSSSVESSNTSGPALERALAEAPAAISEEIPQMRSEMRLEVPQQGEPQLAASNEQRAKAVASVSEFSPRADSERRRESKLEQAAAEKPRQAASEVDSVVVTGSLIKSSPQDAALPVEVITQEELARAPSSRTASDAASDSRLATNAAPATPVAPATAVPQTAPRSTRMQTASNQSNQEAAKRELDTIIVTGAKRPSTSAPGGGGPRGTMPYANPAPSEAQVAKEYREADPGRWLGYIRELRAENKTSEADREWQRFVKAFPNHSVAAGDRARPAIRDR